MECCVLCVPQLQEARQVRSQVTAETSLLEKLKREAEGRVEELEETLMEKNLELQKLHQTVNRLQGEVRLCPHLP